MARKPIYGTPGSVSSGTMRTEDLLEAFTEAANGLHLTLAQRRTVRAIESRMNVDSSDVADDDVAELFDILDAHSLPYLYFGAHPADGSDYGWWLGEGWEESFDGLKVADLSDVPSGHTGEVLHVNDHGNISLYAYSRGKSREVWSFV